MKLVPKISFWFCVIMSLNVKAQGSSSDGATSITYQQYSVRIQDLSKNEVENKSDTIKSSTLIRYSKWLEKLFADVKSGRAKAYSSFDSDNPMLPCDISSLLHYTDSLLVINPATYKEELKICNLDITWKDICLIAFYERWTTTMNGRINKEVIAYAPVYETIDNNCHFNHLQTPLFWIKQ